MNAATTHVSPLSNQTIREIVRRMRFPYVHNLGALVDLLEQASEIPPPTVLEAVKLSGFAVEGRYLGFGESITREEYLAAIALAENVVTWVGRIIRRELP